MVNTQTPGISVIEVRSLHEARCIAVRSPVSDLIWADGRLVLATLGLGSGHPKARVTSTTLKLRVVETYVAARLALRVGDVQKN